MGWGVTTDNGLHPSNGLANLASFCFSGCCPRVKPARDALPLWLSDVDLDLGFATKVIAYGQIVDPLISAYRGR